jgi:hypothetical protein
VSARKAGRGPRGWCIAPPPTAKQEGIDYRWWEENMLNQQVTFAKLY